VAGLAILSVVGVAPDPEPAASGDDPAQAASASRVAGPPTASRAIRLRNVRRGLAPSFGQLVGHGHGLLAQTAGVTAYDECTTPPTLTRRGTLA
jgi:hypothetical protein